MRGDRGIDWTFPYPSRRMPVLARNIVATSQPLAAQAGLDALRSGGNAVDAAVAAAITLTVVEPCNNGVSGDAFAMVHDGTSLHGLNASGRAPAGWTPDRFAGAAHMPVRGIDSVTVPGAVSAWVALSEHFGRLPFARLFDAAIGYAEGGFPVSPKTAQQWRTGARSFADRGDFTAHFTTGGRPPAAGETFRRPELAATLAEIAATRRESFYRGRLAQRMSAHARSQGGALDAGDLAAHRCDRVAPIGQAFAGSVAHELPPNGQGLAALVGLGILAHTEVLDLDPDGVASLHLQVEAMKLAIAVAFRYFADADAMSAPPYRFLDPAWHAALAAGIDRSRAAPPRRVALPGSADTVYLAAADACGCLVSFIQSNYLGFGSGVVVPGTGIALQNRGHGFSLVPGHPNLVGPGKRPYHTIIPGFLTRGDGAPLLCFGVMGGQMQHQGHVQMALRVAGHGQNPQAACDAPRWHVYENQDVGLEAGWPDAVRAALARLGHRVRFDAREATFGGAQLVYRQHDGSYVAASDPRKDGQAAGYRHGQPARGKAWAFAILRCLLHRTDRVPCPAIRAARTAPTSSTSPRHGHARRATSAGRTSSTMSATTSAARSSGRPRASRRRDTASSS
jgi:gamma-glutamyltranspeptidase/glutathione hydrolase